MIWWVRKLVQDIKNLNELKLVRGTKKVYDKLKRKNVGPLRNFVRRFKNWYNVMQI